jgi:transcriptional regulator with XRE-family HTH domain
MQRKANVIGPNVAKFRYQRSWTQEELVAKLQLLGCNINRQILANIETRRVAVTDAQIVFFSEVFGVPVDDLFPSKPKSGNRTMWLSEHCATRPLRQGRS